jgi:hypothetical protein
MTAHVVDLPRYRRGTAKLDAAALMGAGPMTEDDLRAAREEPLMPTKPTKRAATKPTSIRLRPDQVEALDRLGPVLTKLRPEMAALAGGELGPYALLRQAIDLGLAELKRIAEEPGREIGETTPQFLAAAREVSRGIAALKAAIAADARRARRMAADAARAPGPGEEG